MQLIYGILIDKYSLHMRTLA